MLVLLTCTLMVSAPIMCVGGIIMALREDLGLSWLIVVSVTVLVAAIALIVSRMVPQFRLMQSAHRRRQPGAARADHRHPGRPRLRPRAGRAASGSASPTTTSPTPRCGSAGCMAFMFPTVMLVLNVSSVAVLWFGAHRIDDGADADRLADRVPQLPDADPHVDHDGDVHARAGPARGGLRRAAHRGARHRVVGGPADRPGDASSRARAPSSCAASRSATRAPTTRCCATSRFTAGPGQTTAIIGSTGSGKTTLLSLIPRLFDATGGQRCSSTASTSASSTRTLLHRLIGLVPQTAYLFTGTIASNLRYGKRRRHRRRAVGGAAHRAGRRLRRGAGRGARRAGRAGRHQLLRRPAAAAGDRPGARAPAGDLPVRRLVLGARPGHRRPAARGAAADHPGRDGGHRRAAGVDHRRRRPDRRARGRRGRRPRHPRRAARPAARRTPRSSSPSCPAEAVGMSQQTRPAAPPGRRARCAGRARMMTAGMPAEKSLDFWPSAKRLLAPARPGDGARRSRCSC